MQTTPQDGHLGDKEHVFVLYGHIIRTNWCALDPLNLLKKDSKHTHSQTERINSVVKENSSAVHVLNKSSSKRNTTTKEEWKLSGKCSLLNWLYWISFCRLKTENSLTQLGRLIFVQQTAITPSTFCSTRQLKHIYKQLFVCTSCCICKLSTSSWRCVCVSTGRQC